MGLIPREDFINGIMNTSKYFLYKLFLKYLCFDLIYTLINLFISTEFDTSNLEMKEVADLFDRNNRGLIDWKEFIAALRPDWEERKADTEAEKIHDEVKRLVMLCTCRQKFRVFQVGEGKYRVSV